MCIYLQYLNIRFFPLRDYETLHFTAVFTLAYYWLLRVSELVYTGQMHKDMPLQLSDLSYDKKPLILHIRKSKTDQTGKAFKLKIHPADKGKGLLHKFGAFVYGGAP